MTYFIAIFIILLVVNALLLIFSTSVSVRMRKRTPSKSVPARFNYPLKSAEAKYRKAV